MVQFPERGEMTREEYANMLAQEAVNVAAMPPTVTETMNAAPHSWEYQESTYSETPAIRQSRNSLVIANLEAEQSVLGAMLMDNNLVVDVIGVVSEGDFYAQKHGWIFRAITDLVKAGGVADFVTVPDELERRKQLEEIGGSAYVMDLINAVPTVAHAVYHAKIVESMSVLRKLVRAASQITQLCYQTQDADKACADAIAIVSNATERRNQTNILTLDEVLTKTVEKAKENAAARERGDKVSIEFGLTKLDAVSGGMWPDEADVIVIAARPGKGKSALTLRLAHQASENGVAGAVFSLEMTDTQIGERILAPVSGHEILQIRQGDIMDWDALETAREKAATDNLWIDDSPALSVGELVAKVKRLHLRHGIRFIVVDYMQLMTAGRKMENHTQEISFIVRSMKALAKELKIVVVLVVQPNRNIELRQDKTPLMSDLEGSGQIEREASLVLFLDRPDIETCSEEEARTATIYVLKNRSGAKIPSFKIGWNAEFGRFTNEPEPMTESESQRHRERLALQCQALPLTWTDWKIHLKGSVAVRNNVSKTWDAFTQKQKDVITALINGWSSKSEVSDGDLLTMAGVMEKFQPTTPGYREIHDVYEASLRVHMVQRAQRELMPALSEKRFGLMTGPNGRGKSHMARIVQNMVIREFGQPAVWLNWQKFLRDIKSTYNTNGTNEEEIWRRSRASVLILDDPDKMSSEFNTRQLYDVLDEAMDLSGTPRAVILVLNHTPQEFQKLLDEYSYLGKAVAQRALNRRNPVWLNFSALPEWTDYIEVPAF